MWTLHCFSSPPFPSYTQHTYCAGGGGGGFILSHMHKLRNRCTLLCNMRGMVSTILCEVIWHHTRHHGDWQNFLFKVWAVFMDLHSKPSQSAGRSNSKEPCLLTERGDATEMYVALHCWERKHTVWNIFLHGCVIKANHFGGESTGGGSSVDWLRVLVNGRVHLKRLLSPPTLAGVRPGFLQTSSMDFPQDCLYF